MTPTRSDLSLSNAKDYINEAIRKMKYAVDELNDTLEELEACD